jgi:hypothetical protein
MMPRRPVSVRVLGLVLGLGAIVAIVAACNGHDEPTCFAGEYRSCSCASGATGYQQCLPTQDGFAACPCDGKTPIAEAGIDTGIAPGSRQYLESCVADGDCASHVCGVFPTRGNKCSKPCMSADECPAPSPGCNPQLICRSP